MIAHILLSLLCATIAFAIMIKKKFQFNGPQYSKLKVSIYIYIYIYNDNGFTKASTFYLIVMLKVAFMKYIFH